MAKLSIIDDRITALETKLKQEKAKKQKLEALKRQAENKKKRSNETRQKILIGSFFISKMAANEDFNIKTLADLDNYLKTDRDRALFNLPPIIQEGIKEIKENELEEIDKIV